MAHMRACTWTNTGTVDNLSSAHGTRQSQLGSDFLLASLGSAAGDGYDDDDHHEQGDPADDQLQLEVLPPLPPEQHGVIGAISIDGSL